MKLRGGLVGVALGVVITAFLLGATLTALALKGDVHVGWVTTKKVAGAAVEVGEFNASALTVKEVVGEVVIVSANTSKIVLKSNLPLNFTVEKGVLTAYCPHRTVSNIIGTSTKNLCSDYTNGTVIVEVPEGLLGIDVYDVVGEVRVAAEAGSVELTDIVGNVAGTSWNDYRISDVVGDISLRVAKRASINDVIGDITITVPTGFEAVIAVEDGDIIGDVTNRARGDKGTVLIRVNDIIGDIVVGNDF